MRPFIIALVCLSTSTAFSQSPYLDSLKRELETHTRRDTIRFKLLYELSYYSYSSPADTKRYADEAFTIAEELKYDKGIAGANFLLSIYWKDLSDYQKALDYSLHSLRLYEKLKSTRGIFSQKNNIAGIYMSWGDYAKTEIYMKECLDMLGKDSSLHYIGSVYHNLGVLYATQEKFGDAIRAFNKAIDVHIKKGNHYGHAVSRHDIADAFRNSGELAPAEDNYRHAIEIARPMKITPVISSSFAGLGHVLTGNRDYSVARQCFDSAIYYAGLCEGKKFRLESYKGLSKLAALQGDFKKALEWEQRNRALNDSIFNKDKADLLANAQARYETEKKEQTIRLLERDNRIESITRNILIAVLIMTLLSAAAIYRIQVYRDRKNRELLNLRIDYLTVRNNELMERHQQSLTSQSQHSFEAQDDRFLRRVLEVVEQNIADPLFGVEKMAQEMGMSRANLLRKMKSATGFAPSEFIRSVRLKRAARLLRDQVDTVTQIGFMVGFEDQSYFAKSFRKFFGVSPTEYARSIAESTPAEAL